MTARLLGAVVWWSTAGRRGALWNGFVPSPSSSSAFVHSEPVLWAFRDGGTRFTDGFTYTPDGSASRRAS
ncbi:hypothetical protein ACWDR2_20220 [Streptomyces sp. NPDC003631]